MKNMSKRLLSMALVIAMVLSAVPMSFAVEGENASPTNVKIVYDILSKVGEWHNATDKSFNKATYESTNGFWEYVANSAGEAGVAGPFTTNPTQGLYLQNAGTWWAVKITVPKTATYTPVVSYTTHKNNNAFYVYLASVDEYDDPSKALSNGTLMLKKEDGSTKIAGLEFVTANGQENKTAELAEKEIEAGEYYLIYCNDTGSGWRIAGNLTLIEGDGNGNALMGGKITATADEIELGGTSKVTATGYLSSNGDAAEFTYSTTTPDIVEVDALSGEVTPIKAGEATIVATCASAVSGCNTLETTITIAASQETQETGVKIVYDILSKVGDWKAGKPFDEATYETTNGFWDYVANSAGEAGADGSPFTTDLNQGLYLQNAGTWWAVKITVPKTATYTPYVSYTTHKNNNPFYVYLVSVDEYDDPSAALTNGTLMLKKPDGTTKIAGDYNGTAPENKEAELAEEEIEAGEYYLIYYNGATGSGWRIASNFTLIEGDGNGNALMGGKIRGVADELEIGDTATATASAFLSKDGTAAGNFTYSSDSAAITIDAATGALTADEAGTATITATSADALSGCNTITKTVTVKAAEPGEAVEDTMVNFTFVTSDEAAGSVSAEGFPIVGEVAIGTSVEATATANNGYEFAYWRNGAGTVLSTEATATFKFNTNTAVFAEFIKLPDESASEVPVYFYNGNGNLLDSKNVNKGTLFGTAKIADPSLTGFSFMHWSDKDENVAIANNTAINSILRAVAIYKDSGNKYTVKADEATVTSTATYGSEVTVTSSDANFKAWKLGDKVVSYDKAFTFYVWGDVELTSATEGEEAPVAALTTVEGNPLLIYSVPENCEIIEAGILFGNGSTIASYESKAFAKESTGQFTAQANGEEENKTARGYLMFKKDGVIRVIYAD